MYSALKTKLNNLNEKHLSVGDGVGTKKPARGVEIIFCFLLQYLYLLKDSLAIIVIDDKTDDAVNLIFSTWTFKFYQYKYSTSTSQSTSKHNKLYREFLKLHVHVISKIL